MVSPDREADDRDREDRVDHRGIAEYAPAREAGHDFCHDAHRRQDHDVDGGVRIEPEEMLEKQWVASAKAVEDRQAEQSVRRDEKERHREHWRRQDHHQAGRIDRPDEKRHAKPGHARRAQRVDSRNEIDAGGDGAEPRDDHPEHRERDIAVGEGGRVGRIECPSRIDPAREQSPEHQDPAGQRQIPAHEIELRKGDVGRADHQRQQEVAECRGDQRHEEEPHHDDAVQREGAVIAVVGQKMRMWREQFEPDQRRRRAADEKEGGDHQGVEERDALVVGGEKPLAQAPAFRIEIAARSARALGKRHIIEGSGGHRNAPGLKDSERI